MTRQAQVYDPRKCSLGEGPLWHPVRNDFFWFDINAHCLMAGGGRVWEFDGYVSAAGWVDANRMLIAGETRLMVLDLETNAREDLCELEADQPLTRSNDGRADPYGGFWIGTMPKSVHGEIGSIYRYYRGELRWLYSGITITNSICFSPDGLWAYWTDTAKSPIWKQRLSEKDGWPVGDPEPFADPKSEGFNPDGSVVDANGTLWNAQYGASRVAAYSVDGAFLDAIDIPAQQVTCPAFGGENCDRLFVTTAGQGIGAEDMKAYPLSGQTFVIDGIGPGQREHQVIL